MPSDIDRQAQTRERAQRPTNPEPFSRGNSPEKTIEDPQQRQAARGQGPAPDPAAGQMARNEPRTARERDAARFTVGASAAGLEAAAAERRERTVCRPRAVRSERRCGTFRRYVQGESFDNQGGSGQFGPEIQFDTKGVEFGPWIRRFVAQVKRNWFIPYAAMSMKGHVVITFNVHKDGSITDLTVVGPSGVEAFNNAAFGALVSTNPTNPLPPEYPSDKAFFTVTFFYNESPR